MPRLKHRNAVRRFNSTLLGVTFLVALATAGCAPIASYFALVAEGPSYTVPRSVTYGPDHRRSVTYHYGTRRDPLGSVHRYRPDIYYSLFPKGGG